MCVLATKADKWFPACDSIISLLTSVPFVSRP